MTSFTKVVLPVPEGAEMTKTNPLPVSVIWGSNLTPLQNRLNRHEVIVFNSMMAVIRYFVPVPESFPIHS